MFLLPAGLVGLKKLEIWQNLVDIPLLQILILTSSFEIEVSCWIFTGERQTAVIRSRYVQVLLNQDMSFFDTYGDNGDIVSQVLSDVLLVQSALSEKVWLDVKCCFLSSVIGKL